MNNTIKVNELTQAQPEQIILSADKTWADVESVNLQLRKDGSIANYKVNYGYGEVEEQKFEEAVDLFKKLEVITNAFKKTSNKNVKQQNKIQTV